MGGRALLAAIVITTVAAPSPAAVVCKTRAGGLVARDNCRRKETAVNLSDFGAVGPQGPPGADGAQGPQGAAGEQGPPGPFVDTLPSGKTLHGTWAMSGTAVGTQDIAKTAVSFAFPLASAPTPHVILKGAAPPAECPGNVTTPAAMGGHLCIYEGGQFSDNGPTISDPTAQGGSAMTTWGFVLTNTPCCGGGNYGYAAWGTWAVTAP